MNNPRSSNDPDLKAALKAWDHTGRFRDKAFDDATRICKALHDTASHQAYGWAAMTCGRIAAYREQLDLAKILLTEALGRFYLVCDVYGEGLAVSHLAIPQALRGNLDHALELALKPFSSNVTFSDHDSDLLHNNAAQCHWAREESHPAILHLIKTYDLVKGAGDFDRKSVVVGTIGVVLQELGEWDLALAASTEAWRNQLDHCNDRRELELAHLSNMVRVNCQLENFGTALSHAELLLEYSALKTGPTSWVIFGNLAEAFSLSGQTEKAQYCLGRSAILQQTNPTPNSVAMMQVGEARLLEARKNYHDAIALAKIILEQPAAAVTHDPHRYAATVLSRSYAALGRKPEAAKWKSLPPKQGARNYWATFCRTRSGQA